MIFVDTSGWYALAVPRDSRHHEVMSWLRIHFDALITTDHIIDETLTLLRARGYPERAISFGIDCFDLRVRRIHHVTEADLRLAWREFRAHPDRDWSFTDCTSKVVMERFHIKQALSFDRHFLEFGNITLVP
jgi:uncharacterized protein